MTPAAGSALLGLALCIVVTWQADTNGPADKDVCPFFDPSICVHVRPLPDACQTDDECLKSEKCCCSNCWRQCLPTVKEHPGQCPAVKKSPWNFYSQKCQTDSDCPSSKKCCDKKCVFPEKERPGLCPTVLEQLACGNIPESPLCTRDSECKNKQKCCLSDNRMRCVNSVKPGDCPVPTTLCAAVYPAPKPKCRSDLDCPNAKKCCTVDCNQQCTDTIVPISVKPGDCPVTTTLCAAVYPAPKPKCRSDLDCPNAKKCCTVDCHQQCTDAIVPISVKQGNCPVTKAKCKTPLLEPLCKSDSDCKGAKKCCTPLCRQQCTDPIMDKPGTCPVVNTFAPCPIPLPPALCANDVVCAGNQKCCKYGCQIMCTDPVGAK